MTRAQPLWFIDNLAFVHVDGEQSGGAYSLSETWAARGNMPPLHLHRSADETFYVIEGEVRLFIGDREVVLGAGRAALAPRAVPHSYRVESERARWLVIVSPAGYERFLRAVSERAPAVELPPAGRQHDFAALAATAAEHGIEILGPPGTLPADRDDQARSTR